MIGENGGKYPACEVMQGWQAQAQAQVLLLLFLGRYFPKRDGGRLAGWRRLLSLSCPTGPRSSWWGWQGWQSGGDEEA